MPCTMEMWKVAKKWHFSEEEIITLQAHKGHFVVFGYLTSGTKGSQRAAAVWKKITARSNSSSDKYFTYLSSTLPE